MCGININLTALERKAETDFTKTSSTETGAVIVLFAAGKGVLIVNAVLGATRVQRRVCLPCSDPGVFFGTSVPDDNCD